MSRPRGFANWRPQNRTQYRLAAVLEVLRGYSEYLPLTIRQIFYRLVGTDVIGKTEKEYGNLCELLNRARRAHVIDMDAIRDDGFTGGIGTRIGYAGCQEFPTDVHDMAESYTRDRQSGQDRHIVLLCEASGMVPQLERVAIPYGVTVKSSGGFDSLTVKHLMGREWSIRPTTVLHVGDYDPSGECMFDALAEDVSAFSDYYGNDIEFVRLAVTHVHITQYDLPTALPKASSHQAKKQMTATTQAEALDPATLARIVEDGIVSRLDLEVYRQVVETEEQERGELLTWVRQQS